MIKVSTCVLFRRYTLMFDLFAFTMLHFHRKTRKDNSQEKQLELVPSITLSKIVHSHLI